MDVNSHSSEGKRQELWWEATPEAHPLRTTCGKAEAPSPSAASRMVVWPYRWEMSSSDQLKGTLGSVKAEGHRGLSPCSVGHQFSPRWTVVSFRRRNWGG